MGDMKLIDVGNGEQEIVRTKGSAGAVFLSELSFNDLQRLRAAVKRVYMQRGYPVELYTDREADRIIESIGPQTAERLIKALVDQKMETVADVKQVRKVL